MRITGHRMIDLSAERTGKAQASVAQHSAEVSSGLRVVTPSDDPTAWASAERAKVRKLISDGTGAAVKASRDRLEETDGALGSIGDLVARAQELAVQASNATYSAANRAALGDELHSMFLSALGSANTQSSNGEYLFAGSLSNVAPFDPTGAYVGDAIGRLVPAGENTTSLATIPGSRLTAANGVDVLPLLEQLSVALKTNNLAALQSGITDLQTAVLQVGTARTLTGGAMNVLDSTAQARDLLSQHLAVEISNAVESDSIAAASSLAHATTALEASRMVSSHLIALLDPRSA